MRRIVLALLFTISMLSLKAQMRITEFQYNGSEFIEFTNIGAVSIDMTGWSFDDADRVPGALSLSAFGLVQPGESVIVTEEAVAAFRARWNLCAAIKIIGDNTQNLGRSDEINLYNAASALVDRLTYNDQAGLGPRTDNASAWPPAAAVGINNASLWVKSTNADAEASYASVPAAFFASPGKSTRATAAFNPCTIISGAPTIIIDVAATSNQLDGGAASSPASPYAVSGVLNDNNDPAKILGIAFTVADDVTPVNSLTVTVVSSNLTVVPAANLVLTGSGASRNLKITPGAVGYSTITVTVNDGTNNSSYIINYAASAAASGTTVWHTGIADASSAIAIDNNFMMVANDETNFIYVYDRNQPGLYTKRYDFNSANILSLTDGSAGNWKEVDVEAGVKSIANPGKIYWMGSLSNGSNSPFEDKPNRNRLFAVNLTGTGAASTFTDAGHYNNLRQRLIVWGDANGYNFTASAANNKDPKLIDGFNVEGMVFGPDNTTLYVGFRAPLVPTGTRTKAVIAPIQNFESWFNNGSPAGNPTIGSPIELNLGGRGIRELIRLSSGLYIIVAGSVDEASTPAVYKWTGNAADAPVQQNSLNLGSINAEGLMGVNEASGQLSLNKLEVIADNGDRVYYGDNIAAKDLSNDNFRKFSADIILSTTDIVLPLRLEYFTATRRNTNVLLQWKTANNDDGVLFEVQRSVNGRDFSVIQTIPVNSNQQFYSFTDWSVPGGTIYYRISTINNTNEKLLSAIRKITTDASPTLITIYPNPVFNDVFSIVTQQTTLKQISIYTSTGFLYKNYQFSETAKEISTFGWAKGYYIVRIAMNDGVISVHKINVQ